MTPSSPQPLEVSNGRFDLVVFLGVLYHLPNPLLALERVAAVTGDQLVLETVVDLVGISRPAAAFYPDRELNNDPTSWWGPNHAAVHGMLRAVGFTKVVTVTPARSTAYRAARAAYHQLKGKNSFAARRERADENTSSARQVALKRPVRA